MMLSIEHTIHKNKILHKQELSFGDFYFCENILVSQVNEGVVYGVKEALEVMKYATPFYKGKFKSDKQIYIANRIHKYSVKPVGWITLKEVSNYLHAYCVVDNTSNGLLNAILESKFVPVNFKAVTSLDEAFEWSKKELEQEAIM